MMERSLLLAQEVKRFSKQATEEHERGNIENALEAFKQAYRCSKELNNGSVERACGFNFGAALIAAGQTKRGIETLQSVIPPNSMDDGRSNGDLYYNIGLGYESLSDLESAAKNFNKAYEEYKSKGNNLDMEAECLERISQIYSQRSNVLAPQIFGSLAETYAALRRPILQAKALSNMAFLLQNSGEMEKAEKSAEECLTLAEDCPACLDIGNVWNDLGLIFTQLRKYDKAVTCFDRSLPIIKSSSGDKKQEAVILQNLGAVYNFMGDFSKAITYHEQAIDFYGKLNKRSGQSQCFANLAYAYSQLQEFEEAKEAYLHAHQAAKDSNQTKTQWQVLEGLGAISFIEKKMTKAEEYFKKALKIVSASDHNGDAQDRIVNKLTQTLKYKVGRGNMFPVHSPIQPSDLQSAAFVDEDLFEKIKEGKVDPDDLTIKEERKRFIPVGRQGSDKQFHKVARGLSLGTITPVSTVELTFQERPHSSKGVGQLSRIVSSEEESDGDSSRERKAAEKSRKMRTKSDSSSEDSSSSDDSDDEDTVKEEDDDDKTQEIRKDKSRVVGGMNPSDGDSDSTSSDDDEEEEEDDEDERRAVKAEMKKHLSDGSKSSSEESEGKQASSEEEEKESDDSEEETRKPALPTSSPQNTSLGTYLSPVKRGQQTSFKDIDFDNTVKKAGEKPKGRPNFMTVNSSDESEFSIGDSGSPIYGKVEKPSLRSHVNTEDIIDPNLASDDIDRTYQSIPASHFHDDNPIDVPTFEKLDDLPRGEKERYLHEQHKLMKKKELVEEDKQDSRTCVVM